MPITYFSENWDSITVDTQQARRDEGWDWENSWPPTTDKTVSHGWKIVGISGINDTGQALRLNNITGVDGTAYPLIGLSTTVDTGDEIYIRQCFKFEGSDQATNPYLFHSDDQKLMYLRALSGGNQQWRNQFGVKDIGGSDKETGQFFIDLNVHTDIFNQNTGGTLTVQPSTWYCVEVFYLISGVDLADGAMKCWVTDLSGTYNGGSETLIMDYTSVSMRETAHNPDPTVPATHYWITANHGGASEAHPDQCIFYDEIRIQDTKVGAPDAVAAAKVIGFIS